MPELMHQEYGVFLENAVIHAGIGNVQIEDGGSAIKYGDKENTCFRDGIHACVYQGKVERQQNAAEIAGEISSPPNTVPSTMEATVNPSIQPLAMTSFSGGSSSVSMPYLAGEYAAAPKPDDRVGSEGKILMRCQKEQAAAHDLDGVANEHHASFRHGIGESADKRRENHIKQNKYKLEHRRQVSGRV